MSHGGFQHNKVQFPELPEQWAGRFKKGQMYQYQDSLPNLPVPPLEQTLKKYVTGVQPLLSDEEFERTKQIVAEFGRPGGVGEQLQEKLLERAMTRDSWLLEWWNMVHYFEIRKPLVINSNVAIGSTSHPKGDDDCYARLATKFIISMTKFNLLVQNHALPPDMYRKRPLCMVQYDVHSKCRIPGDSVDIIQQTPFTDSRHVIIMRNGHFFKLDVIYECPDGTLALAPPSHIIQEVLAILQAAPEKCEHPVGVLTTEHRDNWYKTRQELILDPTNRVTFEAIECGYLSIPADPTNRATLEAIETAQSVYSLDRDLPDVNTSPEPTLKFWDRNKTKLANRFLHGSGCNQHTINRWFDLAVQVNVGQDGEVGCNLEHSAADGVCAITVYLTALDILQHQDVLAESSPVPSSSLQPFTPLSWNISPTVARDIELAKGRIDKFIGDVDLNVATYTEFGKNFPKSLKLSPDGFIQNALLLTYYKMCGKLTAMHESGSTRMFKFGRTDVIRNTTNQAHTFVKKMQDPSATDVEKANALIAAVKAHSQATMEAIEGQAFDRHLLGLRLAAKESGMEMPEIFKDEAYSRNLHFCLFTSQVPIANYELYPCFGAFLPDSYSVCYNPQENQIIFSVSCFRSCPDTDSIHYLEGLVESMRDMRAVMVAANKR